MICVFAAFVPGDLRVLRVIGLGMAVVIFLEATLVRWPRCRRRCACSGGLAGGSPATRPHHPALASEALAELAAAVPAHPAGRAATRT